MAEKTEWRACEKGGVPKAVDSMHATAVIYRLCGAVDMMVPRETCATCPVPAAMAKAALCDEFEALLGRGFCSDAHLDGGCRACDTKCDDVRVALDKYDELEAK